MIPTDHPTVVAIAGPNGAGKSTFYEAFLAPAGLRFVNADRIARELGIDAYAAASVAARVREELGARKESFVFETVLSDPVGEKVAQLARWQAEGYSVILCFIGLADPRISDQRVAMRVSQGGHDVPLAKLESRFPRTLANLKRAVEVLSHVYIYDNSDLRSPFRLVTVVEYGRRVNLASDLPDWLRPILAD